MKNNRPTGNPSKIDWVHDKSGDVFYPSVRPYLPGLHGRMHPEILWHIYANEEAQAPSEKQLKMVEHLFDLPSSFPAVMDRCAYHLLELIRLSDPAEPYPQITPANVGEQYEFDMLQVPQDENFPFISVSGTGHVLGRVHFLLRDGILHSYGWSECAPAGSDFRSYLNSLLHAGTAILYRDGEIEH